MRYIHAASTRISKACIACGLVLAAFAIAGCRSAYVEATVHNASGGPITLLEVDYPSASFGAESLASGADFHYRFKILGNGTTKVSWTDASKQDHTASGPALHEGEEGRISVTLLPRAAQWDMGVHPQR